MSRRDDQVDRQVDELLTAMVHVWAEAPPTVRWRALRELSDNRANLQAMTVHQLLPETTEEGTRRGVGAVARGLLFTLVGGFMIQAAVQRDPERGEGIEAAWLALLHEPYGRWLLGAVSLGIVAFGLYSMLCARWMRVRVPLRKT